MLTKITISSITRTISSRWNALNHLYHHERNHSRNNSNSLTISWMNVYNNVQTNHTHSSKSLSTSNGHSRSPYTVLKIRTSATLEHIQASFRKLAKQYHPDLNPNRPIHESQELMRELIDAYDQLMNDHNTGRKVGDSRVALACEMYTIDELKLDTVHDVYTLRILYEKHNNLTYSHTNDSSTFELNPNVIIDIPAHPDDSISDVKRYIQAHYGNDWGLTRDNNNDDDDDDDTSKYTRKLDRDGLATGWELISITNNNSTNECNTILGSWFFLHSYNIKHHDIIHAIVRRYV